MSQDKRPNKALRHARKRLRAVGRGAENALQILKNGRLGAPYKADHEVVLQAGFLRLRHYTGRSPGAARGGVVLMVPPLMVTAEVYDISPELSSVTFLVDAGLDVWGVDFGIPERDSGIFRAEVGKQVVDLVLIGVLDVRSVAMH